jgi:hypothetical protein
MAKSDRVGFDTPIVIEHLGGVMLPPYRLAEAIRLLAFHCGESDALGVGAFAENAQARVSAGGQIFQHDGRQHPDQPFSRFDLRAWRPLPHLVVLSIIEHGTGRPPFLRREALLAQALGAERVLKGITVSFPLIVTGSEFAYDLAPFIDGLRRLHIGPLLDASDVPMTGEAIARLLVECVDGVESDRGQFAPSFWFLGSPFAVIMSTEGCQYAEAAANQGQGRVVCRRAGSVIGGPLRRLVGTGGYEAPRLTFNVRNRLPRHDNEVTVADPHTDDGKRLMRELAAAISTMLDR